MSTDQRPPRPPSPAPTPGGFWLPRLPLVRVLAVVLGVAWVGAVLVVGSFLTVASPAGGWFYAALCFLPGLLGPARLAGVRRWRDVLLLAAAASLLLGWLMYQQAPPDHGRLHGAAEKVGVPVDGWELVDVGERGNTWCFKGCPEVTYLYETGETPAQALATLAGQAEDAGWSGGAPPTQVGDAPSEYDPLARGTWRSGRCRVTLSVPPPPARFGWSLGAAERGLTPVVLTFTAAP